MSAAIALATFSGADAFGLIVSALVCVYLVYALLRGENL
jgi:K+-transporting ATPase KdpF subunit